MSGRPVVLGPAALLFAALLTPPAAGGQTLALVGSTVVDGTGAPPVSDGIVVVREGTILCVGERSDCPVPDGAEVVDASGRWIAPGLVDAHVHYSQTGWADGRPDAQDVRDRFPYRETIHWLEHHADRLGRSYLCSGVTATFDVGGYPWTWDLRSWADTSSTMPHVAVAGPLLSTVDHWLNLPAERQFIHMASDSAVEEGGRYLATNGTDAVKVWFLAREGADTARLRGLMETAARTAREEGVPLIVHATGLWQATVAVENGAHLLVHSVEDRLVDQRFLRAAREAGTVYSPTLVVREGYRQLGARSFDEERYGEAMSCVDPVTLEKVRLTDSLPGGMTPEQQARYRERRRAELERMGENLRRVRDAGIPVATATDAGNPLTLHGPAIFLEMEAMAEAGLNPMEVLVASTRNGALAMGRLDDFGTLEAGKVADLVILGADPLRSVSGWRAVEAVMRAGRLEEREALEYR